VRYERSLFEGDGELRGSALPRFLPGAANARIGTVSEPAPEETRAKPAAARA